MSTHLRTTKSISFGAALVAFASLVLPGRAFASHVLFVSDHSTDLSITAVLMGDGHDVTTVTHDFVAGMNPTFHGDLSTYDCIVWSATGDGLLTPHNDPTTFSALTDFVQNGGNVFVTGYESVGYGDSQLIAFLGGTGGNAYTGSPTMVADLDTPLTTGVVDIRSITPTNLAFSDYDALTGLGADTIPIVGASFYPMAAQWSIRSIGDGHVAWVSGGSFEAWNMATSGGNGAWNAAIRNFVAASAGTASVPGAPRVAFTSVFSASEGDELTITAHVTDAEGDTVTWTWDLNNDGTYGDEPNMEMVTIPAGTTDGPGNFTVGVEASDGTHTTHRTRSIRITNVAPTVHSHPPTTAAIDQHIRYQIVVTDPAGLVNDPPTFNMRSGPSTALVTADGVFTWTPTEAEITAPGTTRSVVVDIDDGDMGTTTHMWEMTVTDDHAPSDPSMLYPSMDAPLLVAGLHLAIGNSSDLDGDTITYTFEIDSSPMFDSADAQRMTGVADDPSGITTWHPTESGLHVGRWYWRVSASDGMVTTSPVVSSFLLVPDPTMLPDAWVPDAGPPDAGPVVATPRGCGCSTTSPSSSAAGPLAIFAAIAVVVRARRRRR